MNCCCNKSKLIWSFIFNLAIVIFGVVGVILSVGRHGIKVFQFYTENSNYFALIVSFVYCIFCVICLFFKLRIPRFIYVLRFISTVCLTVTFVMVVCVLGPLYPENFIFYLFGNSNLYQHTICPILSFVSCILFENYANITQYMVILSIIPTLLYGVVMVLLNIFKVVIGPYPFFYFYELPWCVSIFSHISIVFGVVLIAFILHKLISKKNNNSI